jgi:hypothetical protein
MMKVNVLACGLVLATSSFCHAQITTTTTTTTPTGGTEIRRVTQLLGSNVRLQGVNNFGRVEDVVLNDNGGIGYLVVSNPAGRYAMMPWNAATVNYGQRFVTYNVAPQAVQPLFFDRNAWPNITDQQFTTRINQVFPNAGVVRRESLRPVEGTLPGAPAAPIVEDKEKEKVKVKPNGTVKVKEKIK